MAAMLKVGITGGIGSGKTTVCKIFESLGIPVYYADDRAKWLMVNHPPLVKGLTNLFGEEAYLEDGSLNRQGIAQIVFSDKEKLASLNALVHPIVYMDGEQWHKEQVEAPYTLKEAALHFESGGYRIMDVMITVFAPEEMRLERVVKRDDSDPIEVQKRMSKQMPDSEKMEQSDYVIYNDGSQLLIPQILEIHENICRKAAQII